MSSQNLSELSLADWLQGSPMGAKFAGLMCQEGSGVSRANKHRAAKYLEIAAKGGDSDSQYMMAEYLCENETAREVRRDDILNLLTVTLLRLFLLLVTPTPGLFVSRTSRCVLPARRVRHPLNAVQAFDGGEQRTEERRRQRLQESE